MAYMDFESYKFMEHFFTTYNCGLHRQLYEGMGYCLVEPSYVQIVNSLYMVCILYPPVQIV
jgi:hypothetical protein